MSEERLTAALRRLVGERANDCCEYCRSRGRASAARTCGDHPLMPMLMPALKQFVLRIAAGDE